MRVKTLFWVHRKLVNFWQITWNYRFWPPLFLATIWEKGMILNFDLRRYFLKIYRDWVSLLKVKIRPLSWNSQNRVFCSFLRTPLFQARTSALLLWVHLKKFEKLKTNLLPITLWICLFQLKFYVPKWWSKNISYIFPLIINKPFVSRKLDHVINIL